MNDRRECSLISRASVAERTGHVGHARTLYEKVLTFNTSSILALTGLAHVTDENQSLDLIERAVALEDGDPRVLLARGRLPGRPADERLDDARDAIVRDPSLTEARLESALLAAELGQDELVVEELGEALRKIPAKIEMIRPLVRATLELVRRSWEA